MRPLALFFLCSLALVGRPAHGKSDLIERYQDWALWIDIDPMGQKKTEYWITAIAKVKTREAKVIYESHGRQSIAHMTVECGNPVQLYVQGHRYKGSMNKQIRALWITGEKNELHPIYVDAPKYTETLLKAHRRRKDPSLMTLMKRWEEVMIEVSTDKGRVYLPFSLRGFTKASKVLADKCKSRPRQNLRIYKFGESPKKVSP